MSIAWCVVPREEWNRDPESAVWCPEGHCAVFPEVWVDGEPYSDGLAGDVAFVPDGLDADAVIEQQLRRDLNADLDLRLGALHTTTGPLKP